MSPAPNKAKDLAAKIEKEHNVKAVTIQGVILNSENQIEIFGPLYGQMLQPAVRIGAYFVWNVDMGKEED